MGICPLSARRFSVKRRAAASGTFNHPSFPSDRRRNLLCSWPCARPAALWHRGSHGNAGGRRTRWRLAKSHPPRPLALTDWRPIGSDQSRSANCSKSATVATSPCCVRIDRYSSTLLGGFLRRARTLRSAEQTKPGARDSWSQKKPSGCWVSMPKGASISGGKSLRFWVTMASQRPTIAATRTCRSSGSGSVGPAPMPRNR